MYYVINGGKKLKGTLKVSGAKNVALKLIIAALVCEGETVIKNVPRIRDVLSLINIINDLGGTAQFIDKNTVKIVNTLKSNEIFLEQAARTRVSFLLMIPLLMKFGRARVPNPGGCRIGARPVDRLVEGLRAFGTKVSYSSKDGYYNAEINGLHSAEYEFTKTSHTGTEFIIMLAACIQGKSIIKNSALEPEIDELINFLNKSGCEIKRNGKTIIVVGKKIRFGVNIQVLPDRNEAISFITLSVLFYGSIQVKGVILPHISVFMNELEKIGCWYEYDKKTQTIVLFRNRELKPSHITTGPHPGFMTDWQPLWAILMSKANGISTIHETVYENRFGYVSELNKHGANIVFINPVIVNPQKIYQFDIPKGVTPTNQAIQITGPAFFHNAVTSMSDLRAGACLVFAALIAQGRNVVRGAQQIERGYEILPEKLNAIGADISVYQG